jgi:hypothetical protein
MSPRNRLPLDDRIAAAAESVLAARGSVSAIDVFGRLGWLYPGADRLWQQRRLECLEEAMQINPERIVEALAMIRAWASRNQLIASEAPYLDRTPQRAELRFTRNGDPEIERAYRTQWTSPALSDAGRERATAKAKQPELVVIIPHNHDWKCHRCGGGGELLMMETPGPACLRCVGLDDLEFLGAGDTLLTRRAKAKSARWAVVMQFSRSRKRYERQGLLVEAKALAAAQSEIAAERGA